MTAAVKVKIKPEVLRWAIDQIPVGRINDGLAANIKAWLDGTKEPTFGQIEDLSKKSYIPLGYFFLDAPPEEHLELMKYRTVGSIQHLNPSRNLIDTVDQMEDIRDWMRDYRQEFGFYKISVVGSMKGISDVNLIASTIRKDLDLKPNWSVNCKSSEDAFVIIRSALEYNGIIVMQRGIVENNTQRALDIDEFRAFAMIDDWAPLIFINATDSNNGRLFSLLHEAVHVWAGENDLYNDTKGQTAEYSELEKLCNAVTAELLVPVQSFLNQWDSNNMNLLEKTDSLAKHFHCGSVVIGRRALDYNRITQDDYNKIAENARINFLQRKADKSSGGGEYYRTQASRLDGNFVRAVCESVVMGRTTYTEAYRLTYTSPKTFPKVASSFGGVKC
ncbi:MAG: ImmA/IrrE family metallo-endopeptidase [Clostridia bacterium]|nr:ImmA/IrrE family metallo-endopeptidase [Clostridia bacterium]